MRRVVITGVGIVSPLGLSADESFDALCRGESGVRRDPQLEAAGYACPLAGRVPDFRVADYLPKSDRKAAKMMARDIQLAVVAARDAFASAGLTTKADPAGPSFEPARFGCNIGAGLISADLPELAAAFDTSRDDADSARVDWRKFGRDGMQQLTPLWLLRYLPNMLACHVTILHGLTGPSNNITCADASGHLSVGEATRAIRRNKCDLAIAGGCESLLNPMGTIRQQLLGRLTSGDAVRPFSADADGTAPAEGGSLVILEDAEHADRRGARVFARVAGFGAAQDTFDSATPDPEGTAYAAACGAALRSAEVRPRDVDVIFARGIGLAGHDASELQGLHRVFGDVLPPVVATGGQVGNLQAGAAVDLGFAALAVAQGSAPEPVLGERPGHIRTVLSATYGPGGQNAAVVLTSA